MMNRDNRKRLGNLKASNHCSSGGRREPPPNRSRNNDRQEGSHNRDRKGAGPCAGGPPPAANATGVVSIAATTTQDATTMLGLQSLLGVGHENSRTTTTPMDFQLTPDASEDSYYPRSSSPFASQNMTASKTRSNDCVAIPSLSKLLEVMMTPKYSTSLCVWSKSHSPGWKHSRITQSTLGMT